MATLLSPTPIPRHLDECSLRRKIGGASHIVIIDSDGEIPDQDQNESEGSAEVGDGRPGDDE